MPKGKCIAVQVPGWVAYGREVARGVRDYCERNGQIDIWLNLDFTRPQAVDLTRRLIEQGRITGIVFEAWGRTFMEVAHLGVPAVEVTGTWPARECVSVHVDDTAVGEMGARYLLDKGFRSFAFISSPIALHSRARRTAFTDAIGEAGFPCAARDLVPGESIEVSPDEPRFRSWIRSLPKPVGMMCWIDYWAHDVLYACKEEGFRVPEDVSVIGVGNDAMACETSRPPVTSIDISPRRIGYRAMEVLDAMIEGKAPPAESILVPPAGVVERQSTMTLITSNTEVIEAVRYIDAHITHPLEVRDVLKHVRISRRALETHFRRLFGRTPRQHIRHLQIEVAKSLLRKTNLPVEEVARRSGFPDSPTFCSAFRRILKTTPGTYRSQDALG